MGNPVVTVLCTAAICCAIQGYKPWVAAFLILALLIGGWQNWINSKLAAKWLKR